MAADPAGARTIRRAYAVHPVAPSRASARCGSGTPKRTDCLPARSSGSASCPLARWAGAWSPAWWMKTQRSTARTRAAAARAIRPRRARPSGWSSMGWSGSGRRRVRFRRKTRWPGGSIRASIRGRTTHLRGKADCQTDCGWKGGARVLRRSAARHRHTRASGVLRAVRHCRAGKDHAFIGLA